MDSSLGGRKTPKTLYAIFEFVCFILILTAINCFNSGIEYSIAGGGHYGRVEVTIGGKTGTICDASWDNKDASVLCREKNFSEGVALPGAAYGQGKGEGKTFAKEYVLCLQ